MRTGKTTWTTLVVTLVMGLTVGCSSSGNAGDFWDNQGSGPTIEPPKSLASETPTPTPASDEPLVLRPTSEPDDIWDNSDAYEEDPAISQAAKDMVETVLTVDTTVDTTPADAIARHEEHSGVFSWDPAWDWGQLEGWDTMRKDGVYTEVAGLYNVTDWGAMISDTSTEAVRTINADFEVYDATGELFPVGSVIIFVSLKRYADPGTDELGPWVVLDAWEPTL